MPDKQAFAFDDHAPVWSAVMQQVVDSPPADLEDKGERAGGTGEQDLPERRSTRAGPDQGSEERGETTSVWRVVDVQQLAKPAAHERAGRVNHRK